MAVPAAGTYRDRRVTQVFERPLLPIFPPRLPAHSRRRRRDRSRSCSTRPRHCRWVAGISGRPDNTGPQVSRNALTPTRSASTIPRSTSTSTRASTTEPLPLPPRLRAAEGGSHTSTRPRSGSSATPHLSIDLRSWILVHHFSLYPLIIHRSINQSMFTHLLHTACLVHSHAHTDIPFHFSFISVQRRRYTVDDHDQRLLIPTLINQAIRPPKGFSRRLDSLDSGRHRTIKLPPFAHFFHTYSTHHFVDMHITVDPLLSLFMHLYNCTYMFLVRFSLCV